jgi:1,6-anhydro-N-acetylmuramate kinase
LKPEQNPALVYQGTPQCGDADYSARKNYTGNPKDSEIYQSSLKPEQNPALVYQGTPQCGDADYSARKNYTGNPKDSGIVVLNIGGISNLTSFNQNPDSLIAFDCCYGNAPSDDFVRKKFKRDFDLNGEFSSLGKANEKLAEIVLSHKIFHQIPPKSYHRSDFEEALQPLNSLPDYDYLATLCMIFAKAIKLNLEFLQNLSIKNKNKIIPKIILLCGGGRKNLALIRFLQQELPEIKVLTTDEVGLSGDIVEAEAFAYLAIRSVLGLSNSFFLTTGVQNCQNQFGCVGGVLFKARY